MCFSATASFVSGGLLLATGAATVPFVRRPRELPLALLGLGFAGHQLVEGVIWGQVEAAAPHHVRTPAVGLWLLFAWVLLPVWVPAAVALVEPDPRRRRALTGLAAVGGTVSVVLGAVAVFAPVGASGFGGHL